MAERTPLIRGLMCFPRQRKRLVLYSELRRRPAAWLKQALYPSSGGDMAAREETVVVPVHFVGIVAVTHHHAVGLAQAPRRRIGEPENAVQARAVVQMELRDRVQQLRARFFPQQVARAQLF